MLIQCQSEYMGEKCETLDVLSSFHLENIYFHCFIGGSFGLDNLLINSSELICSSDLTLKKRNSIFCIVACIQPDVFGCQQDFLVV